MQVVILAGGLGTRLSEETVNVPKPMVRIGQDPIIVHLMKYYASYGHTDFVIALGYKGDVIKEYFSNFGIRRSNIEVSLSSQTTKIVKPLQEDWKVKLIDTGADAGTGGRLLALQNQLDDDFLMTYGDGLSNVDLDELIATHKKHGRIATVTAVRPPSRFGSLEIENGKVSRFSEKLPEEAGWINGGFFFLNKSICNYISDSAEMFERKPIETIAESGQLTAHQHEGFWQPMDTLRDKMALEEIWQQGSAPWAR
jgi:glucose-1-phosphate cytidylyltransferase